MPWTRGGQGTEALVPLHGIGTTAEDFSAVRSQLEDRFHVLSPDLPGHGASTELGVRPTISALADAVEADLDELGLGRVHMLATP